MVGEIVKALEVDSEYEVLTKDDLKLNISIYHKKHSEIWKNRGRKISCKNILKCYHKKGFSDK